jgi:hypothetical protein
MVIQIAHEPIAQQAEFNKISYITLPGPREKALR